MVARYVAARPTTRRGTRLLLIKEGLLAAIAALGEKVRHPPNDNPRQSSHAARVPSGQGGVKIGMVSPERAADPLYRTRVGVGTKVSK